VEYRVGGPAADGRQWQVNAIQDNHSAPTAFEPLNRPTGQGFVLGAHLRKSPGNNASSWVTGRQLAFAIGIDDPAQPHRLELRVHFPEWLAGQTFTVEFNGGPAWHSPPMPANADEFWQTISIPLDAALQRAGRNFVSIVFERLEHPPETDSWRASALVESIKVTRTDQVRAHQ
jgi:hypothetical protein